MGSASHDGINMFLLRLRNAMDDLQVLSGSAVLIDDRRPLSRFKRQARMNAHGLLLTVQPI